MVMVTTMTWLSQIGNRIGIVHHKRHFHHPKQPTLEILAFEVAGTMSRLISLYKSLYEDEIVNLRKHGMRSQGVAYLNSADEGFLHKLACVEKIEDLDHAAMSVARFGKKCSDPGLYEFEYAYADLKLGYIDIGKLDFQSKEVEKIIDKMVKLVSATSSLYAGLEALAELESIERKSKRWKDHSGPVPKSNVEFSEVKLVWHRQQVQQLKDTSLWSRPFDKMVGFMARTVGIIYARIWAVFGQYFSGSQMRVSSLILQFAHPDYRPEEPVKEAITSKSGPIPPKAPKHGLLRFVSRETKAAHGDNTGNWFGNKEKQNVGYGWIEKTVNLAQLAPPTTVGGSGLGLRYANVIIQVEKYLKSPCLITDYTRNSLYMMLPENLQVSVRSKLQKLLRDEDELEEDESLAEGWRDGLKVILGWLAPMAHDMIRWINERNFEKQNFDAKPRVLLLQTLFFSDKEKTEAAIVEILVGLSCICRYEIQRSKENGS